MSVLDGHCRKWMREWWHRLSARGVKACWRLASRRAPWLPNNGYNLGLLPLIHFHFPNHLVVVKHINNQVLSTLHDDQGVCGGVAGLWASVGSIPGCGFMQCLLSNPLPSWQSRAYPASSIPLPPSGSTSEVPGPSRRLCCEFFLPFFGRNL